MIDGGSFDLGIIGGWMIWHGHGSLSCMECFDSFFNLSDANLASLVKVAVEKLDCS
jgi:hypothetical protein